jgi:hypothetical protein
VPEIGSTDKIQITFLPPERHIHDYMSFMLSA